MTDLDRAPHLYQTGGRIESIEVNNRRVDVWIPDIVVSGTPILVMHDGQNVFFPQYTIHNQTWDILRAIAEGRVQGENLPIVVAVWGLEGSQFFDKSRVYDLCPEDVLLGNPDFYQMADKGEFEPSKLSGNRYQSMIATEIIPTVAATYDVKLHPRRTAIMGSSMGGLASLYGMAKHPDVYGTALCLSTHWAYWEPGFIESVIALLPEPGTHRVWTDRGTLNLDALYELPHRQAIDNLLSRGYVQDVDFQAHIFDGTDHNELAWSRRIEYPLNWWLSNC